MWYFRLREYYYLKSVATPRQLRRYQKARERYFLNSNEFPF